MRGLVFEEQVAPAPTGPNRADIACFVGFVARRARPDRSGELRPWPSILPPLLSPRASAGRGESVVRRSSAGAPLYRWLVEAGWAREPSLYGAAGSALAAAPAAPVWAQSDEQLDALEEVPVPIDCWERFDQLFEWDRRRLTSSVDAGGSAVTYLGAAVRSFFAQGGRFCYVVRVGDPWAYDASVAVRRAGLEKLLPGYPGELSVFAGDRASWRGIGHLFGLPDVSFLCLPDLADAVAAARPPPQRAAGGAAGQAGAELFVECSRPEPSPGLDGFARTYAAPRADDTGYGHWASAVRALGTLLQRGLREVQLVAAVPLPASGASAGNVAVPEQNLLGWLESKGWLSAALNHPGGSGFSSAFVQLAWPWVKTLGSRDLPEQLESPDAVLVGALARNALGRGAFRSGAGLELSDVHDVVPRLSGPDREALEIGRSLVQRVSLLGPASGGMQVLSDVTTSLDEAYRQANVNRLVSALVRAARRVGEEVAFEASGPRLWESIRGAIGSLLLGLWRAGALRGNTPEDAFQVRCDRSTMSQSDLDAGRVVVEVGFDAALAIERIRVVLAMTQGLTTAQVRAA